MNDFTKEELEKLSYVLYETRYNLCLSEKIESMIENYCEHDIYQTSALINRCCNCGKSEVISL